MKSSKVVFLGALLVVVFFSFSCGSSGSSEIHSGVDTITIDSVTPSIATSGTPTTFTIAVSYDLQTMDSGVIRYGFKPDNSNFYILETDQQIISRGSGSAQFTSTKTLTGATTLQVQIAEYPTPAQYSPLANASQAITVNP